MSTINSLSTFVISEMLNGRVIATLMVLVVVEVGLYLRAQARWVPYRHWGFSVRGTSLDTRASAHYAQTPQSTIMQPAYVLLVAGPPQRRESRRPAATAHRGACARDVY